MANYFTTTTREPRIYVEKMYNASTIGGELYIARYQDEFSCVTAEDEEHATHIEKYAVTWHSSEEARSVYNKYENLIHDVYQIAQAKDIATLPTQFKQVYDVYLAEPTIPQEIGTKYQALCERVGIDAIINESNELTKEDHKVIADYVQAIRDCYSNRLGGGINASKVVGHCRRVYKLITINAPKIVLQQEECCLIESLALWMFATSMEKLPK